MRWGRDWRKLYRYPSQEWLALPLSVRGMGDELIRVADDGGRVFVGPDVLSGVMRALDAHASERRRVKADLDALLGDGFARLENGYLTVRNFVEAQTAVTPSAERMRKHRATTGERPSSDRAATELVPSSDRARTEPEPRNGATPREDSTTPVTVTPPIEEKRREETRPEGEGRERAPDPPPAEAGPKRSGRRAKASPPSLPLDAPPDPGTPARAIYDAITRDPILGHITVGPGDLARRLAEPAFAPGVDVLAEVLALAEYAARHPGKYTDGRGYLTNNLRRKAAEIARMPKAAPASPTRPARAPPAPVSDSFVDDDEDPLLARAEAASAHWEADAKRAAGGRHG